MRLAVHPSESLWLCLGNAAVQVSIIALRTVPSDGANRFSVGALCVFLAGTAVSSCRFTDDDRGGAAGGGVGGGGGGGVGGGVTTWGESRRSPPSEC